ncbi:DJ-1/PfpI family protein [bacterium]|nr:DJ-1/PfpI family protein [bacterium]
MGKSLPLLVLFLIIITLGFFLHSKTETNKNVEKKEKSNMTESPYNSSQNKKRVVMIIAFNNFKDEEYLGTKEELKKGGIEIEVVSNSIGIAKGVGGTKVEIKKTIKELNIDDYDGVVFIGGSGALENLDNSDSYRIAKETISKNKILAAICISPVILAKSGVLNGKKATVWSSILDKSPIKELEKNGAIYLDQPVVVDGKIITGNGPKAAHQFGETIVQEILK